MKWLENIKAEKEAKRLVIDKINNELRLDEVDVEVTDKSGKTTVEKKKNSITHMVAMLEEKRKIKLNGLDAGDILKVIANVAVAAVLVGFEMGNILNQKGSKFIKTL